MHANRFIQPLPSPSTDTARRATGRNAHPPSPAPPAVREMLDETVPLIGAPAFAGPPVIFLAGPWLLLTLMLTGPFLLLVTLALLATILVAIPAAILAPPYLLVHRLRQTSTSRRSRRPLPDARRERDSVTVGFVTQRTGTRLIAGPAAHAPAAAQLRNHT